MSHLYTAARASPWGHLQRRVLGYRRTSRSRLNEEAGRMVAGAGERVEPWERASSQSEDGDVLGG